MRRSRGRPGRPSLACPRQSKTDRTYQHGGVATAAGPRSNMQGAYGARVRDMNSRSAASQHHPGLTAELSWEQQLLFLMSHLLRA